MMMLSRFAKGMYSLKNNVVLLNSRFQSKRLFTDSSQYPQPPPVHAMLW